MILSENDKQKIEQFDGVFSVTEYDDCVCLFRNKEFSVKYRDSNIPYALMHSIWLYNDYIQLSISHQFIFEELFTFEFHNIECNSLDEAIRLRLDIFRYAKKDVEAINKTNLLSRWSPGVDTKPTLPFYLACEHRKLFSILPSAGTMPMYLATNVEHKGYSKGKLYRSLAKALTF